MRNIGMIKHIPLVFELAKARLDTCALFVFIIPPEICVYKSNTLD